MPIGNRLIDTLSHGNTSLQMEINRQIIIINDTPTTTQLVLKTNLPRHSYKEFALRIQQQVDVPPLVKSSRHYREIVV